MCRVRVFKMTLWGRVGVFSYQLRRRVKMCALLLAPVEVKLKCLFMYYARHHFNVWSSVCLLYRIFSLSADVSLDSPGSILERIHIDDTSSGVQSRERSFLAYQSDSLDKVSSPVRREVANRCFQLMPMSSSFVLLPSMTLLLYTLMVFTNLFQSRVVAG